MSFLAGAAGIEPTNGGTKNRCLTTWRRPNRESYKYRVFANNHKGVRGTKSRKGEVNCMMIVYSNWTETSTTAEQELERMLNIFSYVLLQMSGDAEQAMDILRELNEQYGLLKSMSMDDFVQLLQQQGFLDRDENGNLRSTPKSDRMMRTDSLNEIFRTLKKTDVGNHDAPFSGAGVERTSDTRNFSFGDQAANIDITETMSNLFKRTGDVDGIDLREDDIRIYETEIQTRCATVVMIDISHSMILYGEDRITPAKQVAIALAELIQTKFPKDALDVVVFGDEARRVSVRDLPYLTVGPFHTNTRDGLRLSRQLLRKSRALNKQIFMITDGKPSALTMENGKIYKNSWGLDQMIVNKTLDEAVACRRDGITIATFMIAQDPYLVEFVEDLTRANHGRAFYTALDGLGKDMFVDYVRNRRRRT